ncbi:MAG: hypothetical protein JRE65_08040 [Deltaproteobacteria bacterium]|jgi:hypothetical protein|nr:hypothetical protein [Deltaproteobacteria bacterium]
MSSNDENNDIQRPNFFDGMMLTADDFQTLQKYSQNKRRRHNRCFRGSRVACGLEVNLRRNTVYIEPGMALDCQGNEIVLSEPVKISLPARKRRFFLTIIYSEIKTNPVPGFIDDYDLSTGKFRRIKESFKLDWSARDPLSGHKWHNGAWVTCGGFHPIAIAKFVIRHGKVMLSKSFEEKINRGRQIW